MGVGAGFLALAIVHCACSSPLFAEASANIRAIAASGQPGALDLFRKILRASASIPGVFPPVMIDVEAGGHRYQEMHVDGGAVAQTFLLPVQVNTIFRCR
jgi:predicted acylesterase/phospholipase RssA